MEGETHIDAQLAWGNFPSLGRYVVLEHCWNGIHYDFMLEAGETLKTWRLPTLLHAGVQTVERLADHRIAYLSYEGPLTGNRGSVRKVDSGNFALIAQAAAEIRLSLTGSLKGNLALRLENQNRWHLHWEPVMEDQAST